MPINDLLSRYLNSRDGAVLVFVALGMTVFIGFTALALDMGYAYWARTKLQIASSTGALAGALDLRDDNLCRPRVRHQRRAARCVTCRPRRR